MLNVSYSDFKNLSWVYWLDPLKQVNQTFEQKISNIIESLKFPIRKLRFDFSPNSACAGGVLTSPLVISPGNQDCWLPPLA